jgi:predicted nucleic acid-binding protein
VFVAAKRSPKGASAALLLRIDQGFATPLLGIALEYQATCRLAEHRLASSLSEKEIDVFLNTLISLCEPVDIHFLWRPQLRDPGDEMVLETAVNGRANAIDATMA